MAEAARQLPLDDEMQEASDAAQGEAQESANAKAALIEAMRIAEALIFAAEKPVEESELARRMPDGLKIADVMKELRSHYEGRGFNLIRVATKWTFRTAADLGWLLSREMEQQKKLSRAALETLAIIAYHQPATRAEIEEIRGVAISKGTLDVLIETGWVRLRGRRKAPGRPVTYGTTDDFLLHFGLEQINDLPGLDELKGAGLFDGRLPPGFGVPTPNDSADLTDEEDPLEEGDLLALVEGDSGQEEALEAVALEDGDAVPAQARETSGSQVTAMEDAAMEDAAMETPAMEGQAFEEPASQTPEGDQTTQPDDTSQPIDTPPASKDDSTRD